MRACGGVWGQERGVSVSALYLVRDGGHVMAWHMKKNAGGEGGKGGVDWMAATPRRKMWQRFASGPWSSNLLPLFLSFWKAHQR